MTSLTITLKDFILIFTFLVTAIGLWLKIRKLRLNDLDEIRKDFADFKDEYAHDREKDARETGKLHACVKNLMTDVSSLQVRLEKHLNQR